MALSVFAMVGCEIIIEDYPGTSSGSTEQGSTDSTQDSSTDSTEDSSGGTQEHTHTYGNWEITNPTQTEEGVAKKVCTECEGDVVGKEITVTLPALTDANYQATEVPATCDQAGKITYTFVYNEETIAFDVETPAKGHTWDNGKVTTVPTTETDGVMTYTCSVCRETKVEAIEKIAMVDAGVATVDTALTFTENETIIGQKKLIEGIKVVGVTGYTVVIDSNKKTADGIDFTNRLKLGGTIKKDYRYIEISVDRACTVKVYAMSSSKGTIRNLNMYASLADLTEAGVMQSKEVNGDTLTAVEYSLSDAGTYYLGSSANGINVYGIYITFPAVEVHNFATEWSYDDVNHYHACLNEGCIEVSEKSAHTFGDGVVTKPATCLEEGVMTYTCTICRKTKTEVIPKLAHNFATEWSYDDVNHYHACLNEGCTEVSGKSAHTFGDGVVTKPATCLEEGVMTYTCIVCKKQKTEVISKVEHNFATEWSYDDENHFHACLTEGCKEVKDSTAHTFGDGVVTKPATCLEEGVMTYTCTVCQKQKTEAISKLAHNFATEWSFDDTNHYHACLTEGCTEVKDSTAHTFDGGIVTKSATCNEEGVKTYTCTICQKQKEEATLKLPHNFAPFWSYDDVNHYHVCLNEGCTEVSDSTAHTFDDGVVTKPATCQEEGVKTYTCTVCPNQKTEIISKQEHNFAPFWSYDGENHFHACLNEGCTEVKDSAAHIWGEGIVTKQPTNTEDGIKLIICTVCPNQKTEVIPKQEHNFATEWNYDDENHFHACLIAGCTEVSELSTHTFDAGVETKPATTEEEGLKTYTCTVCQKTKTEVIPKLPIVDTDIVTADTAITFTVDETVIAEKKLADGVKVVGIDGKTVIIEKNSKSMDGIDFTYRMKLGGNINADSRYIEIKAGMACKVKIYAMSSSSSENRMLYMFKSLADINGDPLQKQDALGGNALSILEFHITEAGTYYIGSSNGGINVYGIYITKAPHAHNFDTANWLSDEETHYHKCLIEGCTEALEKTIHAFGAGVETKPATTETAGEMTYTCTVCGKVKIEEIPKIFTGETISITFSTPDGAKETLTATKDLGNGVKAVATSGKNMVIEPNGKSVGDKTFAYRLKLNGKMNADSRYIEVTVDKPCTIKVYAMSGSSTSTRNLIICKTTPDISNPMQSVAVGGASLEVVNFTVAEAGTYYIGSGDSSINVYGIDILYS